MKNLLLLLILLVFSVAKDFKNISLTDFVQILAQTTNKNIIMSDSVNKDFHIYLPSYNFNNKKLSLKLLDNILKLNNLTSKNVANVILIYKPIIKPIVPDLPTLPLKTFHILKFKFLSSDDVSIFLKSFYPFIKFSVLKHRLLLFSSTKKYNLILNYLNKLDRSYLQRNIKLTIISTLNSAGKDVGTDFKALSFSASHYINLLTSKVDFQTSLSSPTQLFTIINLLKDKGLSRLIDNPNITLSDKKDAIIESTQNIPYLSSTTSTKDNTTTTQNSYDYKDVVRIAF